MKNLNTTLTFILSLFMSGLTYGQTCTADATVNTTGNPGEIEIIDNSTTSSGGAATYSWVDIYEATSWDFEATVYLQPNSNTATYQFNQNGTYNYYISVQDSITNCFDSIAGSITINDLPSICDANFTFNNVVNNVVDFTADSYNSDLVYHWDFGNGTSTYGASSSHTYVDPGTYNVCLTVWDTTGNTNCADTICQSVQIDTNDCIISADYSYSSVGNGVYDFSINNVTPNTIYHWSIESENYSGTSATHAFQSNGQFYATVIATDTTIPTCQDTVGYSINVTDVDTCYFDASFSYYDTVNNQAYFSPNNYDSSLAYSWDFGDGNYSNDPYPNHTYSTSGTYTACLTVWDSAGNSNCADTICQSVLIDSNQCNLFADFSYNHIGNGTYTFQALNAVNDLNYTWNIDNSSYSGSTVTHVFMSTGSVNVTLYVSDSLTQNCTDSVTYQINTLGANNCNFSADFTYTDEGNGTYTFQALSSGFGINHFWSIGNSAYSGSTVTHTFTSNGSFNVTLTVSDSLTQNCTDAVTYQINVSGVSNCDASFSYYDTINNQTYFYPNNYNSNLYYSWDFGDGNYSNNPYPYHTYSSPGIYTACLTVWDNNGGLNCADTVCQVITVNNTNNCDASFFYLDTVNGTTYFLPNNYDQNLSYYWDFGDGNTSTDPFPTHTYSSPGTYTACLNVWEPMSGGQCADTVCQTVVVTNDTINCDANFYLFQDSTNTNVYYIWDLSSGNNLSYSWDFGDGTVSNQQYPTHTYTTQGVFNICLTITDNTGNCTDQMCQTIEVLNKATGTTVNIVPFGETADLEEENNMVSDVKLFPNPTSSSINISLRGNVGHDYDYRIVDVMGNQIELGQLNSNQSVASKEINVEQLQQGVYFVQIIESSNKEKVKTLKFIKK